MIFWRRYNGDYIVFQEKDGEYEAEYLRVDFNLFFRPETSEWVLRFYRKKTPTESEGGTCDTWDHKPNRDEVGASLEKYIDTLTL